MVNPVGPHLLLCYSPVSTHPQTHQSTRCCQTAPLGPCWPPPSFQARPALLEHEIFLVSYQRERDPPPPSQQILAPRGPTTSACSRCARATQTELNSATLLHVITQCTTLGSHKHKSAAEQQQHPHDEKTKCVSHARVHVWTQLHQTHLLLTATQLVLLPSSPVHITRFLCPADYNERSQW